MKREENHRGFIYNDSHRGDKFVEWIERLNETINYIEEHLTGEIDYEELAKIAGCSTYHFQRMFAYMADVSLSEYIRRRKLSMAADDLQGSDAKSLGTVLH